MGGTKCRHVDAYGHLLLASRSCKHLCLGEDWRLPLAIIFAIAIKYVAMCVLNYAYERSLRAAQNAPTDEEDPRVLRAGVLFSTRSVKK